MANLQGAEYYVGGVYETEPALKTALRGIAGGSAVTDGFDWRTRHGANLIRIMREFRVASCHMDYINRNRL